MWDSFLWFCVFGRHIGIQAKRTPSILAPSSHIGLLRRIVTENPQQPYKNAPKWTRRTTKRHQCVSLTGIWRRRMVGVLSCGFCCTVPIRLSDLLTNVRNWFENWYVCLQIVRNEENTMESVAIRIVNERSWAYFPWENMLKLFAVRLLSVQVHAYKLRNYKYSNTI